MNTTENILNIIQRTHPKSETKLVAIDGLGGAGKTTFVNRLVALDTDIKVLELDHFPCLPEENPYHPVGAQTRVNLDRFKKEALIPLTLGSPAIYENTFWWKTSENPKRYEIPSGGIVLVEGCYSYHSDLREFYDYSIWINCSDDEALKRAIKRDGEDGAEIWKKVHAPNERNYALLQKPMEYVDLIINNEEEGFVFASH